MRFVGDDNDVVAIRIRIVGIHILIEAVDQREDIGLLHRQQRFQLRAGPGPHLRLVVVDEAASGKGAVNLAVQVDAVSADQKGEVRPDLPMDLLRQEGDGIALA